MTDVIFRIDSEIAAEPAGFLDRVELPVDGEAIEAPVFETHKRGKNWSCYFTGKNAANADRHFLAQRGRVIDISRINVGSAIEIAGDYTSSGGTPHPLRWIGVVIEKTEDHLVVDTYKSVAKAISAANKGLRSEVLPDDSEVPESSAYPGPLAVNPDALDASVAELSGWLKSGGTLSEVENEVAFSEGLALVLQGLARLKWEKEHSNDPHTAAA